MKSKLSLEPCENISKKLWEIFDCLFTNKISNFNLIVTGAKNNIPTAAISILPDIEFHFSPKLDLAICDAYGFNLFIPSWPHLKIARFHFGSFLLAKTFRSNLLLPVSTFCHWRSQSQFIPDFNFNILFIFC